MVKKAVAEPSDADSHVLPSPEEPITPAPIVEDVPAQKTRPRLLTGFGLGLFAAISGFGFAHYFPLSQDQTAGDLPNAALTELQADVAKVAQLDARIAALESVEKADLTPILKRLDSLEAAPAVDSLEIEKLHREIEALKAAVAPADIAPMVKQAIAKELTAIENHVKAVQSQSQQAMAGVILRSALDTGMPFSSALTLPNLPKVLQDNAKIGLPTLNELQATFPENARAALAAALQDNMGATWSDRIGNFLRSQTGARSTVPREGNDPDAVLSRAEAALAAGEIETALKEISILPAPAQTAMVLWIDKAELRLSAERAIGLIITGEE